MGAQMANKQTTADSSGKYDFVGKVGLFTGISVLLVVLSLGFLAVRGINYGIDFKGGTEFQVRFDKGVTIAQVRDAVEELHLGEVGVQSIGDTDEFIIRFQGKQGANDKETNDILNADIAKIKEVVLSKFTANNPEIRRVDTVGPQVGAELKRNGLLAVFYCLLVILIYVAVRFDFKYAPGAVFCLFHDAAITLGIFVMVGKEVNVPILAAILSLIGYSLNDTIVVFDRIRETDSHYHDKGYKFIINKAINDMLHRTLITSGTVFTSALCLYLFSGGTVADIAFAICIGIVFGTYSSIYVAAPIVLLMDRLTSKKAA